MDQLFDILIVATPTIGLFVITAIKVTRGTPVYSRKSKEVSGAFWGSYPRKLATTEPCIHLPTISRRDFDFSERDNVPHTH